LIFQNVDEFIVNNKNFLEIREKQIKAFKEYLQKIEEGFDNEEKNRLKKEMTLRKNQE